MSHMRSLDCDSYRLSFTARNERNGDRDTLPRNSSRAAWSRNVIGLCKTSRKSEFEMHELVRQLAQPKYCAFIEISHSHRSHWKGCAGFYQGSARVPFYYMYICFSKTRVQHMGNIDDSTSDHNREDLKPFSGSGIQR